MFENLDIFRMAESMAVHAGKRQALIAQNVANSDTPGYKPLDIKPFSEIMQQAQQGGTLTQDHLGTTITQLEPFKVNDGGDSPNGNGVSVEREIMKSVDASRQHDQALAIYKSALTIMRASLGRR